MKISSMMTSLDESGRILLPQLVQSQMGIKPGDNLALQKVNGEWLLKPVAIAANFHDDDLNWEELDYGPIPLDSSGRVTVRIEQRGKLTPMAHNLDE